LQRQSSRECLELLEAKTLTLDNNELVCPKCHQVDGLAKASAIVAHGTEYTSGVTKQRQLYVDKDGFEHHREYSAPYSGTSTTVLAQILAPPHKPTLDFHWDWYSIAIIVGLLTFMVSLLVGSLFSFEIFLVIVGYSHVASITLLIILVAAVLTIALAIFSVAVALYSAVVVTRNNTASGLHFDAVVIPQWQAARQRWDQLFYCSRDDIVFVPGENLYAPASVAHDFVYGRTKR
jgi:hypothetical protein